MRITDIRINGVKNPLGFLYEKLICSWKVTETESKTQQSAWIEVSLDETFTTVLWKTEGEDLNQAGTELLLDLSPRTTYYYRVGVTGNQGDTAVSSTQWFETGKMQEDWSADWITADAGDEYHPIFKKEFTAARPVRRARLYAAGVGLFEAYLNGEKLGAEYLLPYITDYTQSIQTITFDLDGKLTEQNTLELSLGKGWYMGTFGLELQKENYGSKMAAIAELHLEYEDGSSECIVTDGYWTCRGSEIEDSGIYDGEIYNRLLWENSENPEKPVDVILDASGLQGMENLKKEHLTDRLSLPVVEKERITVKEIIRTPAGETILDMGQNFAGWMEFQADFTAGTRVLLEFGEILQEGNFYHKNYREAKSEFVYVSNGTPETVRPHFTFFGFRYVKVTGWPTDLRKEDFSGVVLYSDLKRTGFITTGNEKINRLYENTVWGLKSNFLDMPTDCPQRSERLGWTGDAQVFAPTASYHMDTRAFFHKFVRDLRTEQEIIHGAVPNFLPNLGHKEDAGSVWGDIATLLPNTLFQYFGDKKEMEYCYPLMKDWADWIDQKDEARGGRQYLFNFGFSFGDWLALDGPTPTSFKGSTNDDYISSVYYYRTTQIVREMAELLGKEEAQEYKEREKKIKAAVFHEFFTPSGRLAIDTQAAYVIALKFNICPDREQLIGQFVQRLAMDCNQIKCGFVGAPMLCTVLAECGLHELAYDFLLKEGFPSWLYSVNLGATTIWERWNSVMPDGTISDTGMNSLNHYAYGSVMEFVYGHAAGIRAAEAGFGRAHIAPHPDIRLRELNCSYDSVQGTYVSNWKIEADGMLSITIEIPFNCSAVVELPGYEIQKMELTAGVHQYHYQPATDYTRPYSEKTTLARLSQDETAMGILFRYVPAVGGMTASGDPEMGARSLEVISHMTFLPFDPEMLKNAIEDIKKIRIVN